MALTPRRLTRALDPTTPRASLALMLWHPLPWVARTARANQSTPQLALRLASSQMRLLDVSVTDATLPANILLKHARRHDVPARLLTPMARHSQATPEVLETLLINPQANSAVILAVLENPACTTETLMIAHRVLERLEFEDMGVVSDEVRLALARHALTTPGILTSVARESSHAPTLDAVARHPATPEATAVLAGLQALACPGD